MSSGKPKSENKVSIDNLQDEQEIQNSQLQQNEKCALQAIYADEFEEVNFPWRTSHSAPQFTIHIPEGNLKILFRMPNVGYPVGGKVPEVVVSSAAGGVGVDSAKGKGQEKEFVANLNEHLSKVAQKLKGTEMVYELVETARAFTIEWKAKQQTTKKSSNVSKNEEKLEMKMKSLASDNLTNSQLLPPQKQHENSSSMTELADDLSQRLALGLKSDENANFDLQERIKNAFIQKEQAKKSALHSNISSGRTVVGKKPHLQHSNAISIQLEHPFWVHDALRGIKSPISSISWQRSISGTWGAKLPFSECWLAKASSCIWEQQFLVQQFLLSASGADLSPSSRDLSELNTLLSKVESIRHENIACLFSHSIQGQNESFLLVSECCFWSSSKATPSTIQTPDCQFDNAPGEIPITLDKLLAVTGGMNPGIALGYLEQILVALKHLHSNALPHKSLDTSSVLILQSSLEESSSSSSSKSLGNRLKLINAGFVPDLLFHLRLQPFKVIKSMKDDIFDCGLIFLKCLFGEQQVPSEELRENPNSSLMKELLNAVPEPFRLWIAEFFHFPPSERASAAELLVKLGDLKERKIQDSKKFTPLSSFHQEIPHSKNSLVDGKLSNSSSNIMTIQGGSSESRTPSAGRYAQDFYELQFLGKGAFGQVVKVRNKLDNQIYAIKKILLDPSPKDAQEQNRKILREVGALSRLHHQHITRYFQAWLEDATLEQWNRLQRCLESEASGAGSLSVSENQQENQSEELKANRKKRQIPRSRSNEPNLSNSSPRKEEKIILNSPKASNLMSGMLFYNEDEEYIFDEDFIESEFSSNEIFSNSSSCTKDACSPQSSNSLDDSSNQSSSCGQILYIQMEYCPNRTLKDLIEEDSISVDEAWRILSQVLEALAHIHSLGMIHRDLKPGNILIDLYGNVKVGDFGLVTEVASTDERGAGEELDSQQVSKPTIVDHQTHFSAAAATQGIGTPFYTSPEVISISNSNSLPKNHPKSPTSPTTTTTITIIPRHYTSKVDMYSLGIIFFEMCYPMHATASITAMERASILRALRQPEIIFPSNFPFSSMPAQHSIIRNLLSHDPSQRMSANALLESSLIPAFASEAEEQMIFKEATLKSLFAPSSTQHHRLLKVLFSPDNIQESWDVVRDATFDFDAFPPSVPDLSEREWRCMESLHKSAQSLLFPSLAPIPTLMPCNYSNLIQEPADQTVRFMDSNGNFLLLPFDLLHPFARWIALKDHQPHNPSSNSNSNNSPSFNHQVIKRFLIGPVYRPNVAGGQPKQSLVAAFAKASCISSPLDDCLLMIKAVYLTLASLGLANSGVSSSAPNELRIQLHINHSGILGGILHAMGRDPLDSSKALLGLFRSLALSGVVSNLSSNGATIPGKIKNALIMQHSLNAQQMDLLVACLCLRGECNSSNLGRLMAKLTNLLPGIGNQGIAEQFKELILLIQQFISTPADQIPLQIIINPLLHVPHHEGILFCCALKLPPSAAVTFSSSGNLNMEHPRRKPLLQIIAQGGGIGVVLQRFQGCFSPRSLIQAHQQKSFTNGASCQVFVQNLAFCLPWSASQVHQTNLLSASSMSVINSASKNRNAILLLPSPKIAISSDVRQQILRVAALILSNGFACEWAYKLEESSVGDLESLLAVVWLEAASTTSNKSSKSSTFPVSLRIKMFGLERKMEFQCELEMLISKLIEVTSYCQSQSQRSHSAVSNHLVNVHYLFSGSGGGVGGVGGTASTNSSGKKSSSNAHYHHSHLQTQFQSVIERVQRFFAGSASIELVIHDLPREQITSGGGLMREVMSENQHHHWEEEFLGSTNVLASSAMAISGGPKKIKALKGALAGKERVVWYSVRDGCFDLIA